MFPQTPRNLLYLCQLCTAPQKASRSPDEALSIPPLAECLPISPAGTSWLIGWSLTLTRQNLLTTLLDGFWLVTGEWGKRFSWTILLSDLLNPVPMVLKRVGKLLITKLLAPRIHLL